jgi:hypothetical protein
MLSYHSFTQQIYKTQRAEIAKSYRQLRKDGFGSIARIMYRTAKNAGDMVANAILNGSTGNGYWSGLGRDA